MKKLLRNILTRIFLYAFSPSKGQPGVRVMRTSGGMLLLSLADEHGKSMGWLFKGPNGWELKLEEDVRVIVSGSVLTEVGGSHWEVVSGVKATNAAVLSHQDSELMLQARDIHRVDSMLNERAEEVRDNARKLQTNLVCENCHAPDLPTQR